MVQPINYYDALIPDFAGISLKETQNRAMQNQVSAMRNENSMMRQQAEANRAFQQEWQTAWNSGDDNQIVNLLGKHPAKAQQITEALGIRDGQQKKAVNDMANDLSVALQIGTPAAIGQAISKHPETINMVGSSPEEAIQFMLSNPNGARDLLKTIQLSTMPADKQFDVRDKQEGRAETARSNKAREAENARNNNMVNARGWAGISIQQQNANLARERFDFDKEIRIAETKDKVLSKQLAAETDALKKEELQQKIALNKQKLNETQEARNMSLGYAKEAADLAREIANDSNLGSITGTISPRIGNFYDSSQDLVNKANRLQSLLTQENLKLMSGVLTDRDIVFLGNIASGLNITDGGIKGSESAVRGRLNAIAEKLDSKVSSQGQPQQSQPTQAAQSYSEGMTATNPSTGQKMIFRGGKWQQM